jgi:hypothetical protein
LQNDKQSEGTQIKKKRKNKKKRKRKENVNALNEETDNKESEAQEFIRTTNPNEERAIERKNSSTDIPSNETEFITKNVEIINKYDINRNPFYEIMPQNIPINELNEPLLNENELKNLKETDSTKVIANKSFNKEEIDRFDNIMTEVLSSEPLMNNENAPQKPLAMIEIDDKLNVDVFEALNETDLSENIIDSESQLIEREHQIQTPIQCSDNDKNNKQTIERHNDINENPSYQTLQESSEPKFDEQINDMSDNESNGYFDNEMRIEFKQIDIEKVTDKKNDSNDVFFNQIEPIVETIVQNSKENSTIDVKQNEDSIIEDNSNAERICESFDPSIELIDKTNEDEVSDQSIPEEQQKIEIHENVREITLNKYENKEVVNDENNEIKSEDFENNKEIAGNSDDEKLLSKSRIEDEIIEEYGDEPNITSNDSNTLANEGLNLTLNIFDTKTPESEFENNESSNVMNQNKEKEIKDSTDSTIFNEKLKTDAEIVVSDENTPEMELNDNFNELKNKNKIESEIKTKIYDQIRESDKHVIDSDVNVIEISLITPKDQIIESINENECKTQTSTINQKVLNEEEVNTTPIDEITSEDLLNENLKVNPCNGRTHETNDDSIISQKNWITDTNEMIDNPNEEMKESENDHEIDEPLFTINGEEMVAKQSNDSDSNVSENELIKESERESQKPSEGSNESIDDIKPTFGDYAESRPMSEETPSLSLELGFEVGKDILDMKNDCRQQREKIDNSLINEKTKVEQTFEIQVNTNEFLSDKTTQDMESLDEYIEQNSVKEPKTLSETKTFDENSEESQTIDNPNVEEANYSLVESEESEGHCVETSLKDENQLLTQILDNTISNGSPIEKKILEKGFDDKENNLDKTYAKENETKLSESDDKKNCVNQSQEKYEIDSKTETNVREDIKSDENAIERQSEPTPQQLIENKTNERTNLSSNETPIQGFISNKGIIDHNKEVETQTNFVDNSEKELIIKINDSSNDKTNATETGKPIEANIATNSYFSNSDFVSHLQNKDIKHRSFGDSFESKFSESKYFAKESKPFDNYKNKFEIIDEDQSETQPSNTEFTETESSTQLNTSPKSLNDFNNESKFSLPDIHIDPPSTSSSSPPSSSPDRRLQRPQKFSSPLLTRDSKCLDLNIIKHFASEYVDLVIGRSLNIIQQFQNEDYLENSDIRELETNDDMSAQIDDKQNLIYENSFHSNNDNLNQTEFEDKSLTDWPITKPNKYYKLNSSKDKKFEKLRDTQNSWIDESEIISDSSDTSISDKSHGIENQNLDQIFKENIEESNKLLLDESQHQNYDKELISNEYNENEMEDEKRNDWTPNTDLNGAIGRDDRDWVDENFYDADLSDNENNCDIESDNEDNVWLNEIRTKFGPLLEKEDLEIDNKDLLSIRLNQFLELLNELKRLDQSCDASKGKLSKRLKKLIFICETEIERLKDKLTKVSKKSFNI